jgi:hypothetical protein
MTQSLTFPQPTQCHEWSKLVYELLKVFLNHKELIQIYVILSNPVPVACAARVCRKSSWRVL